MNEDEARRIVEEIQGGNLDGLRGLAEQGAVVSERIRGLGER